MSIELLWIIPIVAAALLILMIILTVQQSKRNESNTYDLKREVDDYNRGVKEKNEVIPHSSESRLSEIEKTIQLVSTALSSQQQTIENFQGKDSKFVDELNELKQKLHELQNEYDTIISENYTLRARLNRIEDRKVTDDIPQLSPQDDPSQDKTDYLRRDKLLNLKIYEEKSSTNSAKLTDLDDTSEINISEIS